MSYVVIVEKRVAFESEHLGEAIAFQLGKNSGVLAKLLSAEATEPSQPAQQKPKKTRKKQH